MSTLWQQFGHGARDLTWRADAILFAEPGCFDSKQAPAGEDTSATDTEAITPGQESLVPVETQPGGGQVEHWRLFIYNAHAKTMHEQTKNLTMKEKRQLVEPAINDLINPGAAGFTCLRGPINLFFGNRDPRKGKSRMLCM